LETAITLKSFFCNYGCSNFSYYSYHFNNFDFRFSYLLNKTLLHLESITRILFLGTNIRLEAPLINARLRKSFLNNSDFKAYSIGLSVNYLTYPVYNFGIL
jgi:NADH dehydrogenase/NADH:ubiquinone oxidoreductase subunit G